MKRLIVDKKYDQKKLNKFLQDKIPNLTSTLFYNGLTTSMFYKTLRKKDIKVNGLRIKENITVSINDEILVYISDDLLTSNISIDIFFEDDNILVINKPYNIEVTGNNSLTTYVHQKYSKRF